MALGALCFACGCTEKATQLVVVVDSDLDPVTELTVVRLSTVHVATGAPLSEPRTLTVVLDHSSMTETNVPFSFGITPRDGDADRRVRIVVEGVTARGVVRQEAVTGFLEDKSLRLPMFLWGSCVAHPCDPGLRCESGECIDWSIDPRKLEPVRPGAELDGSARDASVPDAPSSDVPDAPVPCVGEGTVQPGDNLCDVLQGATDGQTITLCEGRHEADCRFRTTAQRVHVTARAGAVWAGSLALVNAIEWTFDGIHMEGQERESSDHPLVDMRGGRDWAWTRGAGPSKGTCS